MICRNSSGPSVVDTKLVKDFYANFTPSKNPENFVLKRKSFKESFQLVFQSKNSGGNLWMVVIIFGLVLFACCFVQNLGHVFYPRLVLASVFFKPRGMIYLVKDSLIALSLIVCCFICIILVVNGVRDESKEDIRDVKCESDKSIYSIIVGDNYTSLNSSVWDSESIFNSGFDTIIGEFDDRVDNLGGFLNERANLSNSLFELNTSLVQKCQNLFEKKFSFPLYNGNENLGLPIFEEIGDPDNTQKFIFSGLVDTLSSNIKQLGDISNTLIHTGGFEYFSRKNRTKSKVEDYFDTRINFTQEFISKAIWLRNGHKVYSENKAHYIKIIEKVNIAFGILTILSTLASLVVLGLRLKRLRLVLVLVWIPSFFIFFLMCMLNIWLIANGGALNGTCKQIEGYLGVKMISSENEISHPGKQEANTDSGRTVHESDNLGDNNSTFQSSVVECLGSKSIFHQKDLEEIMATQNGFVEWWNEHKNIFEILELDFNIEKIEIFREKIQKFSKFDDEYFHKKSGDKESNLMDVYSRLTSLTHYANPDPSYQKSKGQCEISKDQWTVDGKFCADIRNLRRKGSNFTAEKFQNLGKTGNENCFILQDWDLGDIKERYNDKEFAQCAKQVQAEEEIPYSLFLVNYFGKSINSTQEYSKYLSTILDYFEETVFKVSKLEEKFRLFNDTFTDHKEMVDSLNHSLPIFHNSNNCSVAKRSVEYLIQGVCAKELNFWDKFYQDNTIATFAVLLHGLVLSFLGCCFYNLPDNVSNYTEIEMISYLEKDTVQANQGLSYVKFESNFLDDSSD